MVRLVVLLVSVVLVSCGSSGGGDPPAGGGSGPVGTLSAQFQSQDDFEANPSVRALLSRGGMTLYHGLNPPNIEGTYWFEGRIDYSEVVPQLVGEMVANEVVFQDQTSQTITIRERSQNFGDVVAHGAFVRGDPTSFSVAYTVSATIQFDGYSLTEHDVGVLNGVVQGDGSMAVRVGFVAVGFEGDGIAELSRRGLNVADLLGKPHVSAGTGTPRTDAMDRGGDSRPELEGVPAFRPLQTLVY